MDYENVILYFLGLRESWSQKCRTNSICVKFCHQGLIYQAKMPHDEKLSHIATCSPNGSKDKSLILLF